MNYGNPPPAMNPPPGYGPQPYAPPPKKGMSTGKILLIIFGSIGGVALLCCGGCGAFAWFGISQLEEQIASQGRTNPVIQEHLGGIDEVDFSFSDSTNESQKGTQVQIFHVKGPKGSGTIVLPNDAGGNISSGVLRINGVEYDLSAVDTDFSDELE